MKCFVILHPFLKVLRKKPARRRYWASKIAMSYSMHFHVKRCRNRRTAVSNLKTTLAICTKLDMKTENRANNFTRIKISLVKEQNQKRLSIRNRWSKKMMIRNTLKSKVRSPPNLPSNIEKKSWKEVEMLKDKERLKSLRNLKKILNRWRKKTKIAIWTEDQLNLKTGTNQKRELSHLVLKTIIH
jgi:hypothetical protein